MGNILFLGVEPSKLGGCIREKLKEISNISGVVNPLICLPDLHFKGKMEAPSSLAVATQGVIDLKFSSASLNCGMGLISTNLEEKDFNKSILESFFKEMALNPIQIILNKLHLIRDKYGLSKKEVKQSVLTGAKSVIKKYSIDTSILKNVENNGQLKYIDISEEELSKLLPRSAFSRELLGFGSAFHGNHFLELQVVDKIFNKDIAKKWGLKKGNVVIMYHTGGGKIPYVLGRYYSCRKKGSLLNKTRQFFGKMFFHFIKNSQSGFRTKWKYYFKKGFNPVELNSDEGKKIIKTVQMSMNYGYAYRMGTFAKIRDQLNYAMKNKKVKLSLVYDISHNSIQKQTIKGRELWIHRHNATKISPGKPIILSGYNNTASYICIASKKAEEALFTLDHGAGETIKEFYNQGLSKVKPKYITRAYSYGLLSLKSKEIKHITDEGAKYVINTFKNRDVISEVVKLRPIAGLKN